MTKDEIQKIISLWKAGKVEESELKKGVLIIHIYSETVQKVAFIGRKKDPEGKVKKGQKTFIDIVKVKSQSGEVTEFFSSQFKKKTKLKTFFLYENRR